MTPDSLRDIAARLRQSRCRNGGNRGLIEGQEVDDAADQIENFERLKELVNMAGSAGVPVSVWDEMKALCKDRTEPNL